VNQRGEEADPARILVRVGCAGRVETRGTVLFLNSCYLFRRHEDKLSVRIEEATNEPAGRRAVDLNSLPRDPFHGFTSEENERLSLKS
jgi:hypothetical protein